MKINKESIIDGIKVTVGVIGLCIGCVLIGLSDVDSDDDLELEEDGGYGEAIKDICESDMSDYYKNKCIKSMQSDKPVEYYKAVSSIVNSDMCEYFKNETIEKLK